MDILTEVMKEVKTIELKKEIENLEFSSIGERKIKTEKVKEYYKDMPEVSDSKRMRISSCSNFLEFLVDATKTKKKLVNANFCRDRFCPICSKNLATKNFIALKAISEWIHKEHKKEFIFITLTAPNVSGEKLNSEIKRFNMGFNSYKGNKEIKAINKGFVRKLEVTYNKKDNSYHTHFHVLIAVDSSYFKNKKYIKRDRWLEMWQDVMKDDSITQVDVRRVKDVSKALLEISKYIAKDNDYLINIDVFRVFYGALKGKQMMTYGGLFKDGRKKFKNNELDSYINFESVEWKYLLSLIWNNKEYDPVELNELTQDEIKKYNLIIKEEMQDEL